METASLIAGLFGTAMGILSVQMKKQERFVFVQIFANAGTALSFVLLGPDKMAGGALCAAAGVQCIWNYILSKKGKWSGKTSNLIFFAIYAVAALSPDILNGIFRFPYSLLPFGCAVTFLFSVSAKKSKNARICMTANSAIWIFYDCFGTAFALGNLLTAVFMLTSSILGIFRNDIDWKKLRKKQEKKYSGKLKKAEITDEMTAEMTDVLTEETTGKTTDVTIGETTDVTTEETTGKTTEETL